MVFIGGRLTNFSGDIMKIKKVYGILCVINILKIAIFFMLMGDILSSNWAIGCSLPSLLVFLAMAIDDNLKEKVGNTMKITYEVTRRRKRPGGWIRKAVLAWILAVTAEYVLLERELRDLSGLAGIGEMSPVRLAILRPGLFSLPYNHHGRLVLPCPVPSADGSACCGRSAV